MIIDEYRRNFDLESDYWWFAGTRRIFLVLMDKYFERKATNRVLDIGCGTGIMLGELSAYGVAHGVDCSPIAIEFCRKRGEKNLSVASGDNTGFGGGTFDYITAFGVIEHLKDDRAFMKELFRLLKPGGRALLSTSAYQFLWSEHDDANMHYRRYTSGRLRSLAAESGFSILYLSFFNCFLFPFIAITILSRKLFTLGRAKVQPKRFLPELPKWLNGLLKLSLIVESKIIRHVPLLTGVSLVVIVEKDETGVN